MESPASTSMTCLRKTTITISRSFPHEVYELETLEKIVAEFASMCAEKLRKQKSVCREVRTFIYTNRHRDDQPQRYETGLSVLPEPTSCTPDIVKSARKALRQIYCNGYGYKKPELSFRILPRLRRFSVRSFLRSTTTNRPD